MQILHITDLHVDDFEDGDELLRKGFYEEYIERLHYSLLKKYQLIKVDYIIVTGDFINIGKIENFTHVKSILDFMAVTFSVDKQNICFSIGNHDYKWKDLEEGFLNENKLKSHFKEFYKYYSSDYIEERNNYFIKQLESDVYFLSIDSSWRSLNGRPGEFSRAEEDDLIRSLRTTLNCESTLLIGCHFPIFHDSNFLALEEPDWHEKHVWIKGAAIRDRIKRLDLKNTIWFHGDVHASDQKNIDNETFIFTSKFGGSLTPSEQKRQAIFLEVSNTNIDRITCNYVFPGHNQNPSLGDWECSEKHQIRKVAPIINVNTKPSDNVKSINLEIEEEILRIIKDKGLYQFGRFHISEEYVSLGWVDINKLLSDRTILTRISDKCYNLIKKLNSDKTEETIFLGLEIIGGILSSQLSVRFNIKNSIIPIRSRNNDYSPLETSYSKEFDDLKKYKNIIIFIDIISSGKTISRLVKDIYEMNNEINIHVISILSNDIEDKLTKIPFAKSYSTFCTSLKIPLVKHNALPPEDFLPTNLNFQ